MMPNPRLPLEILDYIVDLTHDKPETLKACCLVAKAWVPLSRKHLFANIRFGHEGDLELWKQAFPDPSNSPMHHTHTLAISSTPVARSAGDWIQAFSRVTTLDLCGNVNRCPRDSDVPLAPFYKFAPTLKSLHVYSISLPYPELFTLVRSSPLLEDLTLSGHDAWFGGNDDLYEPQPVVPSASPAFTGTLDLAVHGGMEYTARQLLGLPNGLHFRRLRFLGVEEEEVRWIMELLTACSDTLECFAVGSPECCTFV